MTCFKNITKDFLKCLAVVKYHLFNKILLAIWLQMLILLGILILIEVLLHILNFNK